MTAENINYEKMVVSFIDILGFRSLIESNDPEGITKILNTFNAFKNLTEWCHKTGDPNNDIFNSISASDCVIRLTRIPEDKEWQDILNGEIRILASIQLELAKYNIIIRGAVTYGDMHFNFNERVTTFFGPAYIKAYTLESRNAVYPRILIDKSIGLASEEMENLNYVLCGKDEEYFIDYMEFSRVNPHFIDEHIKNHKSNIENLIEKNKNENTSIKNKIVWLALYHNWYAKKYQFQEEYQIDTNHMDELVP